jgi:hypothetical protein
MSDYKQWTHAVRESRFKEYKAARKCGLLPAPGPCEICGQTVGTMHHAEDYGPELADYFAALHSLCGRCHAWLHMRFRLPGLWAAYKRRVDREGPQPPVNMGAIFRARHIDIPVIEYEHSGRWWEVLSSKRYSENGELFAAGGEVTAGKSYLVGE